MCCKTEWCEGKESNIILCFPQNKNIRQYWTQFSEWMKASYFYNVSYTLLQLKYRLYVKKWSLSLCPVQTDKTAASNCCFKAIFLPLPVFQISHIFVFKFLLVVKCNSEIPRVLGNRVGKTLQWGLIYDFTAELLWCYMIRYDKC